MPLLLDCDRTHSALYHYRILCIGGPYHQSGRLSFWLSLLQALLCKAQTEISAETPLGLQRLSFCLDYNCHRPHCKLLRPDHGYTFEKDIEMQNAETGRGIVSIYTSKRGRLGVPKLASRTECHPERSAIARSRTPKGREAGSRWI